MQKNCSQKYSLILIVGLILYSLANFFLKFRNLENQHSKIVTANFIPWQISDDCHYQTQSGWDFILPTCDALKIGKEYTIIGTANTLTDTQVNWQNNLEVSSFYLNNSKRASVFNQPSSFKVFFLEEITFLQTYLLQQLQRLFSGHNYQFLAALLLGTRVFKFDFELKEAVRLVGLSHMTAVSGFHLGVVASILTIISEISLPKNKAKLFILPGVLFYAFLVGSPLSVLRATLMLFFSFIGRNFLYKQTSSLLSLFFSFVLMFNQMILNLFNVGFLLSFAATLGIILFANNFNDLLVDKEQLKLAIRNTKKAFLWQKCLTVLKTIKSLILVSIAAQILTLPISLTVFKEYALSSILSTLVFSSLIVFIVSLGVILLFALLLNLWQKILWSWLILPLSVYLEYLLTFFNRLFEFYSSIFAGSIAIEFEIEQKWLWLYYFSFFILFLLMKFISKRGKNWSYV